MVLFTRHCNLKSNISRNKLNDRDSFRAFYFKRRIKNEADPQGISPSFVRLLILVYAGGDLNCSNFFFFG